MELDVLSEQDLELNDPPRKVWVRVRDAVGLLWKDNPKRHDVGSLVQSVQRYGFQDTPKFDALLENASGGQGAIKAGNGRVEVLALMERDGSYELPRGLGLTAAGEWAMPVDVGTDAKSRAEAEAYAIDDNNLTLFGGDLTAFDALRMYERDYTDVLQRLAEQDELPVTADGNDLDAMMRMAMPPVAPEDFPEYGEDIETEYRCPKCGYSWSGSPS